MSRVEQTIDVDVPLSTAYNQWTQFEEFPKFMEGVEDVRQIDDRHCHWQTKVAGVRREFDTEIVDQLPDERISWRTVAGDTQQKGVVSFQPLDEGHTRVRLAMDVEADGMMEKVGEAVGVLDRRVKGDLKRFKGYIEEHGHESGGWRGRVRPADAGKSPMGGGTMDDGPGPVRREPGSMTDPGTTGTTGAPGTPGSMGTPGTMGTPGMSGGTRDSRPLGPRPDDPDSIDRI